MGSVLEKQRGGLRIQMDKAIDNHLSNQKSEGKSSKPTDALAAEIFRQVPCVMQTIRHEMRMAVYGLTIPQFRILARLESGPTNHRDLAEWIGVSLPAISRMVNLLENRELVIRDRQRNDRRYVHLTLSEKGSAFFKKCRTDGQKSLSKRFTNMSVENKKYLIDALKILGAAVKQPEGDQ